MKANREPVKADQEHMAEIVAVVVPVVIYVAVEVFERLGVLHEVEWVRQRVPGFTLVVIAVTLSIVHGVKGRLAAINRNLDDLNALQSKNTLEKITALGKEIDDHLEPVIGEYVRNLLKSVVDIFQDRVFKLPDTEEFRAFYRRTLEVYAGSEFRATSLPSEKFFWPREKDSPIYRAMDEFIHDGDKPGKMTRIFFIEDANDVYDNEVAGILRRQQQLGITVYTTLWDRVPTELRRLFVVDREGKIGWETQTLPGTNVLDKVKTTSNPAHTKDYNLVFDRLLQLDGTRPYKVTSLDPNEATTAPLDVAEIQRFKEFERDSWEVAARAYDQYLSRLTGQTVADLLESVEASAQTRILDVATGPGDIVSAAKNRGADAIGVDFSRTMIGQALKKHPGERFLVADAEQLPFAGAGFDAVIMNFGIMHFGDPERALREATRVLRQGGRLAFTAWARSDDPDAFSIVLSAIERFGVANTLPRGPGFFQFSDLDRCSRILERLGFDNLASKWLAPNWHLGSAEDLLSAFCQGTARIGGLLRKQSEATMDQVSEAIRKDVRPYQHGSQIIIPMTALMVGARKK